MSSSESADNGVMDSSFAKKKRRIILLDDDESSDNDSDDGNEVHVYSVHDSSDDDDDDESSAFEDFDELWDQHVKKQEHHATTLWTQPPVPRSVSTSNHQTCAETPESLAMSSVSRTMMYSDLKAKTVKRPSKVSMSPQQNQSSSKLLKAGSKVTMLEAVVTGASNAATSSKKKTADVSVEQRVEKNQNSQNVMTEKDSKKSHSDKDTANSKNQTKSKEKKKKDSVKKTSSAIKKSKMEATPLSAKKKAKMMDSSKETNAAAETTGNSKSPSTKHEMSTENNKEDQVISSSAKKQEKMSRMSHKSSEGTKASKETATTKKLSAAKSPDEAKRKTPPTDEATSTSSKQQQQQQPPKKKKKRTFQDEILYKMLTSCKPFTRKSLAQSLNTTEAAIHHVMLSLLDKNIIIKKEFPGKGGRSKELYWANQESTAKQVQSLELPTREDMRQAQEEFASLKAKESYLEQELNAVQQELSNEDLDKKLAEMEEAVRMANDKVKETKGRVAASNKQSGSKGMQDPRKLKKRINAMRDEWKNRKTKCMDFVDQLADGMEKPIKEVVKLLDLETDEMAKVTMPPKHAL